MILKLLSFEAAKYKKIQISSNITNQTCNVIEPNQIIINIHQSLCFGFDIKTQENMNQTLKL